MLFRMKFRNRISITFFADFCTINSTASPTVTQPQIFHPIVYRDSMGSYQYTHPLLLLSLHPVTSVVLVRCVVNVFVPCHHGEEAPLDMTASSSTQIH